MQHVGRIIGLCLWHCMIAGALKKCPLTVETWNTASMALQCQPPNYYHCIRDENGRITQQCLQRVWIQPGMCPEFNAEAQRIDVYSCKSNKDDCPTATFWSNAIYVYPGCFFNASSTTPQPSSTLLDSTTKPTITDTTTDAHESDDKTTIIAIAVSIAACVIFVVLIVVAAIVIIRRRHREDSPGEEMTNSHPNETKKMLDHYGNVESEDNSTNLDTQITDYCNKLHGINTDIKICFLLSRSNVTSESKIEEASEIIKEEIVKENDFTMWTKNKSMPMYFFRFDNEHCVDDIKRTLVEVLQTVMERGTKFVIIIPITVWSKDSKIQQLQELPSCRTRYP